MKTYSSITLSARSQRAFALITILAAAFLSLWIRDKAYAQAPPPPSDYPIDLNVTAGFAGNFKYGEWLPVFVGLTNHGPDLNGEIRIPIQSVNGWTIYSYPIELAAGARKRVTVYVLPNNFARQLEVELTADDKLIASQKISVTPNPTLTYLAGLIAPERGALSLLASIELPGLKRPRVLVDIPLAEIPERAEGLRSFDLLVLSGQDTSTLTPAQGHALEAWVRQGGRLVVGGGSDAALTTAGLPKTLFPSEISSPFELSNLDALEAYTGKDLPILVPGPFVAASVTTDLGKSLIQENENPLLNEWKIGSGYLNYIALDPVHSPYHSWNGATAFWSTLTAPGAAFSEYLPSDISARQQFADNMPYVLSNLPILDLPSARALAVMLLVYIVIVGPVNYLVLKRKKKLHFSWITIPAITVLFSAASFGLGYVLHGTDIFINKITVIQDAHNGAAHYEGFVGVFSPAQTSYEIKVQGGSLLSPLIPSYDQWNTIMPASNLRSSQAITLSQGDPAYVKGLSVDQWSMQSFKAEGELTEFGTIGSDLMLESDRLTGTVTNHTSHSFQDSYIVLGNKFVHLGKIDSEERLNVSLDLTGLGSPNFSSSLSYSMFEGEISSTNPDGNQRRAEVRRSIVEALFERTPSPISALKTSSNIGSLLPIPVFLGWMNEAPPEISIAKVEPGSQTTAVVLFPLDYKLPATDIVVLPVGMIPGDLSKFPKDGGTCGAPGMTSVFINSGEAVFEFTLPSQAVGIKAHNLKLAFWTDSEVFTAPEMKIFDWSQNEWYTISGINPGVNLIPEAEPYIRSDGLIQLQLSAENAQYCYYLGLGLEGARP